MTDECARLHTLCRSLKRFKFPFDEALLPRNGIYVLFEKGEVGHGGERIVRVGSHTGEGQLPSRLRQHFIQENKDRSIFRKHIGRALLAGDAYALIWELDMTTKAMRDEHGKRIDREKQQRVEHDITRRLREHCSFVVFDVADADDRLALEAAMIATVATCGDCHASTQWLGNKSPVPQICKSGMWLVQHLNGTPLTDRKLHALERAGIR